MDMTDFFEGLDKISTPGGGGGGGGMVATPKEPLKLDPNAPKLAREEKVRKVQHLLMTFCDPKPYLDGMMAKDVAEIIVKAIE
jgi:hypothetical protein